MKVSHGVDTHRVRWHVITVLIYIWYRVILCHVVIGLMLYVDILVVK